MSRETFIDTLEGDGVASDCAAFVWEEVQPYYFAPLTPHPDDHFDSVIRGDPDDLGDMAAAFWKQRGVPPPSRKAPAMIPRDPTLLTFAHWLDDNARLPT